MVSVPARLVERPRPTSRPSPIGCSRSRGGRPPFPASPTRTRWGAAAADFRGAGASEVSVVDRNGRPVLAIGSERRVARLRDNCQPIGFPGHTGVVITWVVFVDAGGRPTGRSRRSDRRAGQPAGVLSRAVELAGGLEPLEVS